MVAINMFKDIKEAIIFLMFDMESAYNGANLCDTADNKLIFKSAMKTSTLTRKYVGFQGYKSLNWVSYLHLH
jgi:hypothetical protein